VNIKDLLQDKLQEFILQHEAEDEKELLLKHKYIVGVPASLVADQIAGRKKAKLKLPTWHVTKNIIYPPSVNVEQCSSEATATFKVEILKQNSKADFNRAVDLTGGFGVDSFFVGSLFKEVDYVESDENLFEITRHNHKTLQAPNIQHHHTIAEQFLNTTLNHFDLVYIDPSRRTKGNQKIFRLADCIPDITQLQDIIFDKADVLLVKASPMLDLQQGIKELNHVEKVFVVAVDNECKEVLFLCRKGYEGEPVIEAVDLKMLSAKPSFSFLPSEEKISVAEFSNPLRYLYEPHAGLLKAGAFKLIAQRFRVNKLQQHTHLYTSEKLLTDFPGRIFEIVALIKPDPKVIKQYFPEGKANVVTRNYPLSPEELKKKTGLKDGGEKFLIGFSGVKEKFVAVCNKIIK
jgi:hypothetical protein